jgi:hypothetical protein
MRILVEIVKQIDDETREVWSFYIFELNVVFVAWHRETKPKGKRKWTIEKSWDKYGRNFHNMVNEPVLPETIRSEVITEVMKHIKVKTWNEWKGR